MYLARVRVGSPHGTARPRTHLLLGVQADGTRWHADVGFGHGTLREPIPFGPGGEYEQSGWRHRVVEDGPELVLQSLDQSGEWVDLYGFVPEPVPLIDVVTSNWYTCTYPRSPFVTGLIVSVQRPDGTRESLSDWNGGLSLTEETPAGATVTDVEPGRGPGGWSRPASASRRACLSDGLTVAVTGPTGTFGFGLIPLLQSRRIGSPGSSASHAGRSTRPSTAGARWNTGRATSAIPRRCATRSNTPTRSSTSRS